jgi:energy-coupling factor transporter ATP-binding protein EcfA2
VTEGIHAAGAAGEAGNTLTVGLPVIRRLDVTGYGMYPGTDGAGIRLVFQPGLTLVIGANGIGKSTLMTILFRVLTGPFDIPRIEDTRDLGSGRLEPVRLSEFNASTLARRTADGARSAKAKVVFDLAGHEFAVERRLDNLTIVSSAIDGQQEAAADDEWYQGKIVEAAGLGSFADWMLLVRHVAFYFEDRRALVWDQSAQRQILRLLFLPPGIASEWTTLEREILSIDSRMRNLQAALGREERELAKIQIKTESAAASRAELTSLEAQHAIDSQLQDELEVGTLELETARADARVRHLAAEQMQDSRLRDAERAKLLAVGAAFPSSPDTARYILAQLMAGDECLVCGHHVPDVAAALSDRVRTQECVVCGSPVASDAAVLALDPERLARALLDLQAAGSELSNAAQTLADAEEKVSAARSALASLRQRIAEREQRIGFLLASLPPEEAAVHERRGGFAILKGRVDEMKVDLVGKRLAFRQFMEGVNRTIVQRTQEIKDRFDEYASGFLLEQCSLTWAPSYARVGQSGEPIPFPSFELTLTGSDFAAPVRRSGPGEVSESQREFIDLAFRMALISVAATAGVGTLLIDAPESSLDTVFSRRAATVLMRFATHEVENRVIVTSNLVEGSLVPSLVALGIPATDLAQRVVDLIELASPTAAVRALHDDYVRVRDDILSNAK